MRLVELAKKGIDAWTERFDHIDDHFMGRHGAEKRDIGDWVPVDGEKPQPLAVAQDPASGENSSSSSTPGASSDHAIELEETGPKRKASESSNDGRKAKKARVDYMGEILVICCQCSSAHNPKLDQSCTYCPSSHRFSTCCSSERRPHEGP